ncbi:hypothetical protein [Indioceanicola profundi]|uniref:hypothetical protein n=1 Tax=Indioceanicola profundi TaxID=2220096 RepID=UPI000E6AE14C|nr:hypothetical protein [Indioceanicola profundi]
MAMGNLKNSGENTPPTTSTAPQPPKHGYFPKRELLTEAELEQVRERSRLRRAYLRELFKDITPLR